MKLLDISEAEILHISEDLFDAKKQARTVESPLCSLNGCSMDDDNTCNTGPTSKIVQRPESGNGMQSEGLPDSV